MQTSPSTPIYEEGSTFATRRELFDIGLHRQLQAGIAGNGETGAQSIVLSGGYEDDEDFGEMIVYTGQGGRDQNTGQQISNQDLIRGNLALAVSHLEGLPVRVIRGASHRSSHSPTTGYRYDGLYMITDHWQERGRSGFLVWRYRMVKAKPDADIEPKRIEQKNTEEAEPDVAPMPGLPGPVARQTTTVSRQIRDSRITRQIKQLYNYTCQVCGERLDCPAGPYAEGAHIPPLGAPHDGPDTTDNVLCLCPNHHILFDYGALAIADDFSLIGSLGKLRVHPSHSINPDHIRYHRERYSPPTQP